MVKNCCAVGYHNVYKKGSEVQFYRFPTDPEKRARWVSAIHLAPNSTESAELQSTEF